MSAEAKGGGKPPVPYITKWTGDQAIPGRIVLHPNGIGIAYADETLSDRDANGVLWSRTNSQPGQGKPEFGNVNSLRQRHAMRRLLCQVCANPADQTDDGVLWVLKDHRHDWPGWPNGMGVTEPPICQPCLHTATRACPALRRGHAIIRAREFGIAGVHGTRYQPGSPVPTPAENTLVALDDPAISWTCAAALVRRLGGCVVA